MAGRDYPRTYREFAARFPDEAACSQFLEALRCPQGFTFPACGVVGTPWRDTRGRLECPTCRHQKTVTAGTILEKTRTPLTTWFEAAWHMTTTKNGLWAKILERTLGTRYRVAWSLLQRFRVARVRAERAPLSGTVEVDEALVEGVKHEGKNWDVVQKSDCSDQLGNQAAQVLWSGQDAPDRRCLGRQSAFFRVRYGGSGSPRPYRWLERLPPVSSERLRP